MKVQWVNLVAWVIVIGTKDSYIEIISPIDDTPAYRAGLQAGDIILQIGDQNVNQNEP